MSYENRRTVRKHRHTVHIFERWRNRFLIYINDPPQAVQHSSVTMYADDTSLCHQSRDLTQLNEAINSDLKKLETWLQGNKLSFNVAQTRSMLISTKQKGSSLRSGNETLELKIRDNELVVVQKT